MNIDWNAIWKKIGDTSVEVVLRLLAFVIIIIIGFAIIRIFERNFAKNKAKSRINPTLRSFLGSFLRIGLRIVVLIIALLSLGVANATIVAVIGSAGIAVGLALQGSLSNLASGFLILTNHLFEVGDYIEFNDSEGTVNAIGLFYTKLTRYDGIAIYVPNTVISSDKLINYSANPLRRMDLAFDLKPGSDIEAAKAAIMGFLATYRRALRDPAPYFFVEGTGSYYTRVRVRYHTKADEYWDSYFEIYGFLLDELKKAGIEQARQFMPVASDEDPKA